MFNFQVIKPGDFIVHGWSGGVTSEIFLYPEGSDYKKKNFQVRISSAQIKEEGTPYTDFSGFTRFISPIQGQMRIFHTDHHNADLDTYEIDQFDGGWETRSYGLCTDFNLLLSKQWNGKMECITTPSALSLKKDCYHGFFVCDDSKASVSLNDEETREELVLKNRDFLLIESIDGCSVQIKSEKVQKLMYVRFSYRR